MQYRREVAAAVDAFFNGAFKAPEPLLEKSVTGEVGLEVKGAHRHRSDQIERALYARPRPERRSSLNRRSLQPEQVVVRAENRQIGDAEFAAASEQLRPVEASTVAEQLNQHAVVPTPQLGVGQQLHIAARLEAKSERFQCAAQLGMQRAVAERGRAAVIRPLFGAPRRVGRYRRPARRCSGGRGDFGGRFGDELPAPLVLAQATVLPQHPSYVEVGGEIAEKRPNLAFGERRLLDHAVDKGALHVGAGVVGVAWSRGRGQRIRFTLAADQQQVVGLE